MTAAPYAQGRRASTPRSSRTVREHGAFKARNVVPHRIGTATRDSSGRPRTCGDGPRRQPLAAARAAAKNPRDRMKAAARARIRGDIEGEAYATAPRNSSWSRCPSLTSNNQRSSVSVRKTIVTAAAIACVTAASHRSHAVRMRDGPTGSELFGPARRHEVPISASSTGATAPETVPPRVSENLGDPRPQKLFGCTTRSHTNRHPPIVASFPSASATTEFPVDARYTA